jgi:hypothetical protein
MFKKLFGFSNLTLLVALILSTIAAWYSIIGLTAIFAGAVIPIIIMGSALELAKITTTVWLRKYWKRCSWIIKIYLVPAVVALALLTSMGIFGFLSKAHLDQGVPTSDVAAKVALFDEKIKTERDNIETSRKALQQMDAQVDQMLGRTDSDKGAERAVAIRRQQAKERSNLQGDIAKSQTIIAKLNEERAPIASELRKVEAEVGPIKYIAALIYGDNPDSGVLEKAVRWVIILIVVVFDPLALTLLLAATKTFEWEREKPEYPLDDGELSSEQWDQLNAALKDAQEENDPGLDEFFDRARTTAKKIDAGTYVPPDIEEPVEEFIIQPKKKNSVLSSLDSMWQNAKQLVKKDTEAEHAPLEAGVPKQEVVVSEEEENNISTAEKEAQRAWKLANPNETIKKHRLLHNAGFIDEVPWNHPDYQNQLGLEADNAPNGPTGEMRGFGTSFPASATKGDMFLRVDQLPSMLYKFNGNLWIEVDKTLSDQYAYDTAYIDHLIEKIDTGEYDPDLLSNAERDSIEQRLKNTSGRV